MYVYYLCYLGALPPAARVPAGPRPGAGPACRAAGAAATTTTNDRNSN